MLGVHVRSVQLGLAQVSILLRHQSKVSLIFAKVPALPCLIYCRHGTITHHTRLARCSTPLFSLSSLPALVLQPVR